MMKGAKWLREASYLTDEDREQVMRVVNEARCAYEDQPEIAKTVGVRAPSYIGEPHPIATVTVGGQIFRPVYRIEVA